MRQPADQTSPIHEPAMIRQLKREGRGAHAEFNQPLCDRIMQAVDGVRQDREAARTALAHPRSMGCPARVEPRSEKPAPRFTLAIGISAATAAALLLGLWSSWPAGQPQQDLATAQTEQARGIPVAINLTSPPAVAETELAQQPADDLFSAPAVAAASLSSLQQQVNPMDELSHDAELAGQMALSTLPLSAMGTD